MKVKLFLQQAKTATAAACILMANRPHHYHTHHHHLENLFWILEVVYNTSDLKHVLKLLIKTTTITASNCKQEVNCKPVRECLHWACEYHACTDWQTGWKHNATMPPAGGWWMGDRSIKNKLCLQILLFYALDRCYQRQGSMTRYLYTVLITTKWPSHLLLLINTI